MIISTDGTLPGCYAPIRQIGLKIALGMENFPSNRTIMCYGPPSGGKSTLLYSLAGEYIRNQDEVWIVDAERAIDEIYLASYLPGDHSSQGQIEALKYLMKASESRLKKESKASKKEMSEDQCAILEKRIEMLPQLIKSIKEGIPSGLDPRTERSLIRRAQADWRLRNISLLKYDTIEEFEKDVAEKIEARKEDPDRRLQRLLIGVDSINYLLPEEVLGRATSSEGSNFSAARYMHTLLPKLTTKLAGTETSIFFIHQKTTTIKMNFWETRSAIDDVATKGGSAAKFGATIMVGVEKRKRIESLDGKTYDSGIIDIPKAKLRGGSKGTYKGSFLLKESVEQSTMDFNEPFIRTVIENEEMGIRKERIGRSMKIFVPVALLKNNPQFEEKIAPNIRRLPSEEESAEPGYYQAEEAELVTLLATSKEFEEECLYHYDIMRNV
jgi:RecA/RadA recombinase